MLSHFVEEDVEGTSKPASVTGPAMIEPETSTSYPIVYTAANFAWCVQSKAMEVASLVLAVANMMDPLIRLGRHTSTSLQRSSHFGIDAEKLRVSFKRERRQVEAMRRLLLMKAEGLGVDTTVFEQLDDSWQADLLDELRQLRALTRELEELENRYYIFAPLYTTLASHAQPPTESVVNLALAEDREAKLQRAATKPQLLRWGFKDGKRATRVLDDLHIWVRFFKEDLEM